MSSVQQGNMDDNHPAPIQPPVPAQAPIPRVRVRAPTPEDVALSRKMYIGGFFFLPLLWLVNYVHFRHYLASPAASPDMKSYIRRSAIGCVVAVSIWIVWLAVYYTNLSSSWAQSIVLVP